MTETVMIAAYASDPSGKKVIGLDGEIPWHIPEDLKRFKDLTVGHPVIMGRETFDSIMRVLGKPLPRRTNYVLSRSIRNFPEGVVSAGNVGEIFSRAQSEARLSDSGRVFVIGGQTVYEQFMDLADRLEITEVNRVVRGDRFFPNIDLKIWQEDKRKSGEGYSFVSYSRHHS